MAKRKKPELKKSYEYIKAFVSIEGELRWEYKALDSQVTGRQSHDEDVSAWTDLEIAKLTRQTLDAEEADLIEVIHD